MCFILLSVAFFFEFFLFGGSPSHLIFDTLNEYLKNVFETK